jgi:hypothetical protein
MMLVPCEVHQQSLMTFVMTKQACRQATVAMAQCCSLFMSATHLLHV